MTETLSVPTGLLSDAERAFLRGERDGEIDNPEQYERNVRYNVRQRIGELTEDLDLLEAHGHDDLIAQFYHEVSRTERLRADVALLAERLDDLDEVDDLRDRLGNEDGEDESG